jgi:tetratricopeptide (TPR) repeat protein
MVAYLLPFIIFDQIKRNSKKGTLSRNFQKVLKLSAMKKLLLIFGTSVLPFVATHAQYDKFEQAAPIEVPRNTNEPVYVYPVSAYPNNSLYDRSVLQSSNNIHNAIQQRANRTYGAMQEAKAIIYESDTYFEQGLDEYKKGFLQDAKNALNKSRDALLRASSVYYFKKAHKERMDNINIFLCRMNVGYSEGASLEDASRYFKYLSKKGKKSAMGKCLLGKLKARQNQTAQAEKLYKESIRKDKKCMYCYESLITLYNYNGETEKAAKIEDKMNKNRY